MSLPLALAQVCPAATTDEVSLIAVPAHMPKPISLKPSIAPKVGKRKAAITLKRKITEIDWAMSLSDALVTGAAAAICRAAADRRTYAYQSCDIVIDFHYSADCIRHDQGSADR